MNMLEFAARYARALSLAAEEQGKSEEVREDIERIASVFERLPELRSYCFSVKPESREIMKFAEIAFIPYVGKLTEAMLRTAIRNGRIRMIPFLKDAFEKIAAEQGGEQIVTLETARTAEAELVADVQGAMEKKLGCPVLMKKKDNPDLIGGFRLWWGGRMIDSSVAGRLNRLKRHLRII